MNVFRLHLKQSLSRESMHLFDTIINIYHEEAELCSNNPILISLILSEFYIFQLSILVAGLVVFVVSILLVYYLNAKAHILFPHDPTL